MSFCNCFLDSEKIFCVSSNLTTECGEEYESYFIRYDNRLLSIDGYIFSLDWEYKYVQLTSFPFSHFHRMSKEFKAAILNLSIKTRYETIQDHPVLVFKKESRFNKSKNLMFYEDLFKKLTKDTNFEIPKLKSKELYDIISSFTKFKDFNYCCIKYIDHDFLLYETDFCIRTFGFLSYSQLSIEEMKSITSWILEKKIRGICMAVIALVPTSVEEFIFGVISNKNIRLTCNINELTFLYQVCPFNKETLPSLMKLLFIHNVDMDFKIISNIFNEESEDSIFLDQQFIVGLENSLMRYHYYFMEIYLNLLDVIPSHNTEIANYVRLFKTVENKQEYLEVTISEENTPINLQLQKYIN